MVNPFLEINLRPDADDLKRFGRTVAIGMLILSVIFLLANIFLFNLTMPKALLSPSIMALAGIIVLIMAYFLRLLALPVYYIWFIAGASIGIVVSNVLLAVFFYLVFTPLSLLSRLIIGRDPLKLRRNERLLSNWGESSANKPPERYFKQY